MERRKICRYFERGACRKDNCPFVHLKQNRKACNFYMEGNCRKGVNCNFYHPPKQQEKIANLKMQLTSKIQKQLKVKESSEQEEDLEKKQIIAQQQQGVLNEIQKQQEVKKQEKVEKQKQLQEEDAEQAYLDVNEKIAKINFLLGLNSSDSEEDEGQKREKQTQIQFLKVFQKKFPDLSKTPEIKAFVQQNEQRYFKQKKFLELMKVVTDPIEKEYYQIIRRFQDSYKLVGQNINHFTLAIRPLIYNKQMDLHFQMKEDTLVLQINARQYPEKRAIFQIINQSIPAQYKEKMVQQIKKLHERKTIMDVLKFLQNNFEKLYQDSKFKLENEHYSRKQLERKLEEEKKKKESAVVADQVIQKKVKKIKKDRNAGHPDVIQIKYKQKQKVENLHFGYQITVDSLLLQNCEYIVVEKFLAYIQCRCEKKFMYVFDACDQNSLTVGIKLQCRKCQSLILLGLERQVVQQRRDIIGHIGLNNALLLQLGGIAFKIGCSCDNVVSKGKIYLCGERVSANCYNCFQTMNITYMGLKCFNSTLRIPQVQLDKQLINKGACKHVKLSFRWFRYGCCGRTFSCDDCHIVGSISLHEKAKGITMLCGFCSREQMISDQCGFCKKQLVKGVQKSGHWQGGYGCRDPNLLSKKDAKKYTGLTKKK